MSSADWRPSASIDTLRQRAYLIAKIRAFFNDRAYLEVDTPALARYGVTDNYLNNIPAFFREERYCLQTSPEYHMKRLLASGSGPIFQLARVFRDDELGRWHNPEFTLLEWYHLECDHHALMDEVNELLQIILTCPALIRKTYQQVFDELCSIDPLTASVAQLKQLLAQYGLDNVLAPNEQDKDQFLFLLMSHVIEPALAKEAAPVAIYNFPPSQAALAKIEDGVAERFEVYYRGVELANGFHELTDAILQQQRFQDEQHIRAKRGLPDVATDPQFLAALKHGLPSCSGVALGVDRLLAIALNQQSIAEIMSFGFDRA